MAEEESIPYHTPMHLQGSNIILMTNPQSELYKLELTYRGMMEDENGNLVKIDKPLMNKSGINKVLGVVRSVVNQVTIMSNIEKDIIPQLMNYLSDTLCKDLMMNRVNYEIGKSIYIENGEEKVRYDPSARDKVFFTAVNIAYYTMLRGKEGDDKRFWKGQVFEQHTTVQNNSRKRGILDTINPWRRGEKV